jgi:hypothetical protein
LNEVAKVFHIHNISGFRVNFSGHFYYELVVVTMKIGIVALPKNFPVLFGAPIGIFQFVCGIEMLFSEYGYFHLLSG